MDVLQQNESFPKLKLNQEEVLTRLKKAADNKLLKIVNKNNKNSYRLVQETHLDEECVIDSQICETLESTDGDTGISIRLDKTSKNNLTNLTNQFELFEAETQPELTSLPDHFVDSQKGTHLRKISSNLDSTLLSWSTGQNIQCKMGS